jgi:hypothetical protein
VIEADAHPQNALVEVAHWVGFRDPSVLQGLVLLEELAAVELLEAADHVGGRQSGAAIA